MIYLVWLLHKARTHIHAHLQLLPHTHTYICSLSHTHTHWERFGSLDIKQQQPFAVCLLLSTEGAFLVFVHFNWPLWMMWPSVLIALSLQPRQRSPAALISAPYYTSPAHSCVYPFALTLLSLACLHAVGRHLLIINAVNCSKWSTGGAVNAALTGIYPVISVGYTRSTGCQ